MIVGGVDLSRLELAEFMHALRARHPELDRPVALPDFWRIAERERLTVQFLPLSDPARLLRVGSTVLIQIDRRQPPRLWATLGMHELCHYWRDDVEESCYHAEAQWVASPSEDFAELFAWHVTQNPRITVARGFLDGDGSFSVRVAGTSYRQPALERIAGQKEWRSTNQELVATAILENANPYDANAVRVEIFGEHVGYLCRADALRYRELLRSSGWAAVAQQCLARIAGGWERGGGDRGHYGVRLDIRLVPNQMTDTYTQEM